MKTPQELVDALSHYTTDEIENLIGALDDAIGGATEFITEDGKIVAVAVPIRVWEDMTFTDEQVEARAHEEISLELGGHE